jgi:RNA-directed DNA polymerase
MTKIAVSVKRDHIEALAATKRPIVSLAELMWNSLDADADKISVSFEQNALGALERIRVTDNGNGIPYGEAELLFGSLGGSWKSMKNRTASHEWMLRQIPTDTEVLRRWLKAGYVENRTLFPTEAGTPQGGIISPTLANMTLDGLEQLLKVAFRRRRDGARQYRLKVNLIRYADDFIITGPAKDVLENEVRPLVEQFLRDRGLQLSPEKTCITHIEEGFDFLGQNLRKYDGKLLIKPSKKNTHNFLEKVRTIIQENRTATQEILIRQLNPVIRGWANYHKSIVAADTFNKVDHVLWQSLWRWAKRRHPNKSGQWVMRKYWHTIGQRSWVFAVDTGDRTPSDQIVWLRLRQAADTKIRRHPQIKGTANPFDPRWRRYFEDRAFLKRFGIHRWEAGIKTL